MEKNYIIRIYHRKKSILGDEEKSVTGLVEEPLTGARQPFHDSDELWNILSEKTAQKDITSSPDK